MGHDFPENLEAYDLIIHCDPAWLTETMLTRIALCKEKGTELLIMVLY